MKLRTDNVSIGRGALAGAAGGLLGALAMSGFASLRSRVTRKTSASSRSELVHLEASRYVRGSNLELDSIALAADRLDRLTGHKMSPGQKSAAAAGVHFGLGALLGGLYGTLAEFNDTVTRYHGVAFAVAEGGGGNFVWTSATKTISQYSVADHVDSIADHAIYGLTLETVRRFIRGTADGG